MYRRYAIYYTPAPGTPLAEFGADWLGWDSAEGRARSRPAGSAPAIAQITAAPRKYGFHGTIKPPFHLAEGTTVDALQEALADLCASAAPVTLDGLHLSRLGRFLALVPTGDASALAALAGRAVKTLDAFRAPASEAELAKRRAANLSPAQEAHLLQWGYPYVLDQFRFHMTLTGRLARAEATQAEAMLGTHLAGLDLAPYRMTGLTLLGEDAQGMFHQLHRYTLTG